MNQYLDIAITAARAAGDIIKRDYTLTKTVSYKDGGSIVTTTDTEAETAILNVLNKNFPDHAFFGEESGDSGRPESDYIWVIDPLDGTTNFTRQLSQVAVSIALQKNHQPQIGVVYNPLTDQLFSAVKSRGACLNNQPISPSPTDNLTKAVIGLGRSPQPDRDGLTDLISKFSRRARTVRVLGSHALQTCYVANGQLDAYVAASANYYDIAAASLIAQEAGAAITDFTTKTWQPDPRGRYDLLAANPQLASDILNILTVT